MKTLKAYFGLDADGAGVTPATSVIISVVLSVVVSVVLRLVLPATSYPLRLLLWAAVMIAILRWAANNARRQREKARRRNR